jgi:probable O-glycosylation ligase (exosortase A-associated)
MRYLQLNTTNSSVRLGLTAMMLLTGVAILGTQSRGALLGGGAMIAFMWLKSRSKASLGLALIVAVPLMVSFMPESWTSRMQTIQTYQEDQSAMERIFAWRFSMEMAESRLLGGGFGAFAGENYDRYAPDVVADAVQAGIPENLVYQAAHSIYFSVLGEHGIVGLILFVMLGVMTWRTASRVLGLVKGRADLKWAGDLAGMVQGALIGYGVGGAFLSLEYFDLVYHLIAIVVLVESIAMAAVAPARGSVDDERALERKNAVSSSLS